MEYSLRNMVPDDRESVARLIFRSTNRYYESIGRQPIFKGEETSPAVMFDVYEQIDPGRGLVAVDDASGEIVGSCFVHPRERHVSLGIMNVAPEHFGQGIARRIIERILDEAKEAKKPVRLVSSCLNLDSYSLYTRSGFVPYATYQDMYLEVPKEGVPADLNDFAPVRQATLDDVDAMADLEMEISGIYRRGDYRYFIENPDGLWRVCVLESSEPDKLDGFLVSCGSTTSNMLGPGVAKSESQAASLLLSQLNEYRGRMPVFLVPVHCGALVRQLYRWGARNCEMHLGQSFGPAQSPRGVTMPTFLPETG